MKKQTISTEKVLNAYRVLSTAKYTKLSDEDKIKVWKIARQMKPVAEKFEDDTKDASDKMKPSEDFDDKLAKAQEYELKIKDPNLDPQSLPMGAAEYGKFLKEFQEYNKLISKAIKDFADKEIELEFECLSDDAFGKLMASNEWTLDQVMAVSEIITV